MSYSFYRNDNPRVSRNTANGESRTGVIFLLFLGFEVLGHREALEGNKRSLDPQGRRVICWVRSLYNCCITLISFRHLVDDHYDHLLHLFRETETGVARLQASVRTREFGNVPIWTAFITNQIRDAAWARRDGPRVVLLADLQQFIFTTDYSPQKAPTGEIELTFSDSRGTVPVLVVVI